MRKYQVFPNPFPSSRAFAPLVVVLSSHLLDSGRAIVAPLLNDATSAVAELHVRVEHDGVSYVAAVHDLSSVERPLLRRAVGDLAAYADDLDRVVHSLFTGF